MNIRLASLVVALAFLASEANATIVEFQADMDGLQARAGGSCFPTVV